ncbi:MAG: acylglycerol kinase family protein [Pseudomonadota bacterium]
MSRAEDRVGLISNPGSGHNRDQFPALQDRIAHSQILHTVTRSAADIDSALQELASSGVSILGINGGDGTASAILGRVLEGQFFDVLPSFVILPGGTANMNAGDVGIGGGLRAAVTRFCDCADRNLWHDAHAQRRHLLRLRTADGALHHGMFLGAGAILSGTAYAHEKIHSRGLRDDFSLALGTARTVFGVVRGDPRFTQHQTISIQLGQDRLRTHHTLILAISTLQRLAFGMRPFWGCEPGPLRMTLMEAGCTRFARTFLSIARGKPSSNAIPEQGYFSHNADAMTLSMTGDINLDGEILSVHGEVYITATPALTFLQL